MLKIITIALLLVLGAGTAQAQFFNPGPKAGGGYTPQPYYCGIACPNQQPAAVQTKRKRAARSGTEQPERKQRSERR